MSPEVISKLPHSPSNDIWSCGIVLYILLIGEFPFKIKSNIKLLLIEIKSVKFTMNSFNSEIWKNHNQLSKSFLLSMLDSNPAKRWKAEDLLKHEFFIQFHSTNNSTSYQKNMIDTYQSILNFSKISSSQKVIRNFFIINSQLTESYKKAREMFVSFDTNNDGRLSFSEICQAVKDSKMNFKDDSESIKIIFSKIDTDHNGYIDFSEFLTCALNQERSIIIDSLKTAFEYLDSEGKGKVRPCDFINLLIGEFGNIKPLIKSLKKVLASKLDSWLSFDELVEIIINVK